MGGAFAGLAQSARQKRKVFIEESLCQLFAETVRSHRKQGFGIPLAAWFRGPLADWSRELLLDTGSPLNRWFNRSAVEALIDEHNQGRADHGKRLYALSMLALWGNGLGKKLLRIRIETNAIQV